MRKVFADALYWIATVKPNDPYERAAREARQAVGSCILVTTDEVLGEFVTAFCNRGSRMRARAVATVEKHPRQPRRSGSRAVAESFLQALDRFSNRPDKQYSLTDCSSMNVMDAEGIQDVLTNDHHFQQEGFNVLIRSAQSGSAR